MGQAQVSAQATISGGPRGLADAEEWLGGRLRAWNARTGSTARWLMPAEETLSTLQELVLFAQYDPLMMLFTVEIWRSGQRVYGIDDWLG